MASALNIAERRLLRAQWLRAGRCLRCFHSTRYTLAEEASPTQPSPRRQRAAAVASELGALAAQKSPSTTATTSSRPVRDQQSEKKPVTQEEDVNDSEPILNAEGLLRSGQGTSTIAGGNFRGVLVDRLRQAAGRPGTSTETYFGAGSQSTAMRGTKKLLTAFTDAKEREEYMSSNCRPEIVPPSAELQQDVTNRLVNGKYEGEDLFGGKEKFKQTTLNYVARAMTLNPAYSAKDAARFVNKVRGLIPAAVATPKKAMKA